MALTDVCPHRGAGLSRGECYYRGCVTCPEHAATFNGAGECVAWLTEGPESRMVGRIRARTYPTRTLKGWVFVCTRDGEPAPIQHDVPPEFFEPRPTLALSSYTYWYTNWIIAIENQNGSDNCTVVDSGHAGPREAGGRHPRYPARQPNIEGMTKLAIVPRSLMEGARNCVLQYGQVGWGTNVLILNERGKVHEAAV